MNDHDSGRYSRAIGFIASGISIAIGMLTISRYGIASAIGIAILSWFGIVFVMCAVWSMAEANTPKPASRLPDHIRHWTSAEDHHYENEDGQIIVSVARDADTKDVCLCAMHATKEIMKTYDLAD